MKATTGMTREQAIETSRRYLNAKGYEIEGTWEESDVCGLVATDGNELIFVQTQYQGTSSNNDQEAPEAMRLKLEHAAISWLSDNEECYSTNFSVRFDIISLLFVSHKRALLRHRVNALGTC